MFVKKNREKRFHDEIIITIHFFDQALRVIVDYMFVKKSREKNSIEKHYMFVKKIREKSLAKISSYISYCTNIYNVIYLVNIFKFNVD
jgi:hypothetical protein